MSVKAQPSVPRADTLIRVYIYVNFVLISGADVMCEFVLCVLSCLSRLFSAVLSLCVCF